MEQIFRFNNTTIPFISIFFKNYIIICILFTYLTVIFNIHFTLYFFFNFFTAFLKHWNLYANFKMFFLILFCYTVILYGHTFIVMYISVPTPITCGTRAADLPDTRQLVLCPANCSLWSLSVFGSGVYASISSICGAAIHR